MDTTDTTKLIGSTAVYRYSNGKLDPENQVFENPNQAFLHLYMKDIHSELGAEDFVRRGNVYFVCVSKLEQMREEFRHPVYGIKATQRAKKEEDKTVITVEYKPLTPTELCEAGYVNLPTKFLKRMATFIETLTNIDPDAEDGLVTELVQLKMSAQAHNGGYANGLATKRAELLNQILEKINVNDDMNVELLEQAYYIRLTPLGISLVAKAEDQVPQKIAVKNCEVIVD